MMRLSDKQEGVVIECLGEATNLGHDLMQWINKNNAGQTRGHVLLTNLLGKLAAMDAILEGCMDAGNPTPPPPDAPMMIQKTS